MSISTMKWETISFFDSSLKGIMLSLINFNLESVYILIEGFPSCSIQLTTLFTPLLVGFLNTGVKLRLKQAEMQ